MKKPCENENDSGSVFEKIIGFGENSVHKSYYPELQEKITNLKKTEEELRQIKDELEARVAERTRELEAARAELFEQNRLLEMKVMQRTEEFLLAKEKAEEASRAKSLFLANMSHELRTPLNGIMGFSDILAVSGLNDRQSEFNKIIKMSSINLLELINNMFDISEFENKKIIIRNEPFDLRELAAETIETIKRQAENKKIELYCEISPEIDYKPIGDRRRVEQIMINLLSNAVKFTSSGKAGIKISQLFKCENFCQIEIEVSDEGIGISPERLDEIFEIFHQLDESSTKRHGGAGIGLSIVKRLVELMKGEIFVESRPGEGSRFIVKLPFEIIPTEKSSSTNTTKDNFRNSREPVSVLLAEDNDTNSLMISAIAAHLNWRITSAKNGIEAVALYKNNYFDIVLMDIQMPEMDGIEAARAIRKFESDSRARRTPIIAFTAYATEEDRSALLKAGLDDYIIKPVLSPEILRSGLLKYLN